jgi:hypothetical protein
VFDLLCDQPRVRVSVIVSIVLENWRKGEITLRDKEEFSK